MTQIALISWSYSPFYGNETSQRRTLQIITQMYGANRKVYYLTSIVGGGGYAIQIVNICMRETEMYVQFPVAVKLTPA